MMKVDQFQLDFIKDDIKALRADLNAVITAHDRAYVESREEKNLRAELLRLQQLWAMPGITVDEVRESAGFPRHIDSSIGGLTLNIPLDIDTLKTSAS